MATNTQVFSSKILLNDQQARQIIAQLEKSLEEARKKRKEAFGKGEDVKALAREITNLSATVNTLRTNQEQVNRTLGNLSSASYKDLKNAAKSLEKQLRLGVVERNSQECKLLNERLKNVRREMVSINNEAKVSGSVWSRMVNMFNKNWGAITQTIAGFGTLRDMVQKCSQAYADMEESMADVRKYTGQTDELVHQMNEDFKKMDTRTAREQLNELAGFAGRLALPARA